MTVPMKIAIVDDHTILRNGLKMLLRDMQNTEVVIEASNGKEFIDQLQHVVPDLVIIDINMPVMKGDEAVKIARQMHPNLKVIVLSMNSEEQFFKIMNDLGVDGYIIKESDYDELEHAIETVMKGGKYFSQELLLNMVNNRAPNTNIQLTEREQTVLNFLCRGFSANEIADKLFISPRTVEKHRSDLLLRTGTPNSVSLVVFAIKNALVRI
ncbi:MAG TPA: response regulator transcription factor [Prolixibacteraceae bacterium]|nr:response regulator transcription factor [Prolixibacteraceae bacterium]